jgi:type IV pilus assembly protein PilY1
MKKFVLSSVFGIALAINPVMSVAQVPTVSNYDAVPPLVADSTTPLVMLGMSNDHQLYYKAFTDWDDLDNDNIPENTYTHSIFYAGYFDSYTCYSYSTGSERFEPYSASDSDNYCDGATWSGNFLNWATMTRMDEIRLVLYGGKRSTDTDSLTVLERAYLPHDAHSFAKFYNGTDLGRLTPFSDTSKVPTGISGDQNSGLTICNTTANTDGQNLSQNVTSPPLIRVAQGNYTLWAANERWQCRWGTGNNGNSSGTTGIYSSSSAPNTSDAAVEAALASAIGDYVARVEVCNASFYDEADAREVEDCKEYPDGNLKPVGLLQQYGEDNSINFGLLTGSYAKNKSGGVLRKNVGAMNDEINTLTDGTFVSGAGIIDTLNRFRIARYGYDDGLYNDASRDNCEWGLSSFSEGRCSNWGNPLSEILLECYRYFAGEDAQSDFATNNDSNYIPGLSVEGSWDDPISEDNACAKLYVIGFNASTVSYDADQLDDASEGVSSINSSLTSSALTDVVGAGESIHGNSYFVGENGVSTDQLCTAKTVTSLGSVEGTCPAAPRLDGSYRIAGIAHHAHTNDIRTDVEGDQLVTTYGVTLSPALPQISIPVPSSSRVVTLLPACRNLDSGSTLIGNCGLVDFKIVDSYYEDPNNSGEYLGKLYVNWEDSEQGGDYDQDMAGIIEYRITSSQIEITTDVFAESTIYDMGFGYVISGTTDDGVHFHSGIEGFTFDGCSNCQVGDGATSQTFNLGASTASLLEQPLYYAAKWGGFEDDDGDGTPNLQSEWDTKINATDAVGSDGIPDNYIEVINPLLLKQQLGNRLDSILERTSSGTAAAVNAQTGRGSGSIYQAIYTPKTKTSGNDLVTWTGELRSYFLDDQGRFREDTNSDGQMTLSTDRIMEFEYDDVDEATYIRLWEVDADGDATSEASGSPFEMTGTSVKPVWRASEELGALTDLVDQRTYSTPAGTGTGQGRYIFTSFDRDGDGLILNPEYSATNSGTVSGGGGDTSHDLVATNFSLTGATAEDYRFLGLGGAAPAQIDVDNLVNYIRGEEITGFRSRTLGSDKYILGDIVNSTPSVVGKPGEQYQYLYNDDSYEEYVEFYEDRRNVVYVGANDGMLHAFNAGFFDPATLTYSETNASGATAHPLGAELWSYVPYNLLPHLQWLTSTNYPHVYYMDGSIQVHDVNIFTPDSTHINGWGTIIVASMRFGGGDYSFDHDGDVNTPNLTTRSAYVVLDVTDPESPPTVIAEITDDQLGFTTAAPTVVKYRQPNASSGSYKSIGANDDGWYLVFGSGPIGSNALSDAVSDQEARLYYFDLNMSNLGAPTEVVLSGDTNSFVGGITSVDWDRDYIDDMIYLGLVGGTPTAATGKMKRGVLSFASDASISSIDLSSDLYNADNLPISAQPLTYLDRDFNGWVFYGTGRYFVSEDNISSQQQRYYGIKEPILAGGSGTVSNADLVDTTQEKVYEDSQVTDWTGSTPPALFETDDASDSLSLYNFEDARQYVADNQGWVFDLHDPASTTDFADADDIAANRRIRNTTLAALAGDSLVITAYQVTGALCSLEGDGYLYTPHFAVGLPAPFAPLDTDPSDLIASEADPGVNVERVLMGTWISKGLPSAPIITRPTGDVNSGGCDAYKATIQTSTGEVMNLDIGCESLPAGRQGWREIPVTW